MHKLFKFQWFMLNYNYVVRQVLMLESLPIIALTAEIGATIREDAMKAGASHFLNKPAKAQVFILDFVGFC